MEKTIQERAARSILFVMPYSTTLPRVYEKVMILSIRTKQKCRAKATIELSGQEYIIERKSEKYVKRLKGEVSPNEAKTDVNFTVVDGTGQTHELNGTTSMETDRNIAKYFGTMDDFLSNLYVFANRFPNFH